jgi:NAD-dependent DNA ligase
MKTLTNKTLAEKKEMYLRAKDEYYNSEDGKSFLTDAQFDKLEDAIRAEAPKWSGLKKTGILGKKKPIRLLVPMPSLTKCKAHDGVAAKHIARLNKFDPAPKAIMEKLDGASVISHYEGGKLQLLATRGDGIIGQEITFLAPYCKTLPKTIKRKAPTTIRMEAVLTKSDYKRYYKDEADSARAGVSGALNRTEASPMLNHIHFVALRMLEEDVSINLGLLMLADLGFITVRGRSLKDCTDETLTTVLEHYRETSMYECDGIVVHANKAPLPVDDKKPKFAFAYKLDEETENAPITKIVDIFWKKSAFNVLVPKAIIEPVDFDGVTVKRAALHNYEWARSRGCGIGAEVRVIRSGDIIPKIVKVEKAAPMSKPPKSKFGDYTFDGTNLVCVDKTDNHKALLQRFFQHTGLDGFGPALAEEFASVSMPTWAVCRMTEPKHWGDYVASEKMGIKLAREVVALQERITLDVAMAASGVFEKGVGSTRIRSLLKAYPLAFAYLTTPYSEGNLNSLMSKAQITAGCGPAFSNLLSKGYKEWCTWYKKSKLDIQPPVTPKVQVKVKTGKYAGKTFSWTGYRSKEEEAAVVAGGGEVIKLGSKTNVLFYNPNGKFMSKVDKAAGQGVTVVLFVNY